MKRIALLLLVAILIGSAFAANVQTKSNPQANIIPNQLLTPSRTAPTWNFSIQPTDVLASYYDYMIGGYSGQPVQIVPAANGGGYYLTFHGNRTSAGVRRVFYAYVTPTGMVQSVNEISTSTVIEGYPSMAMDALLGYPFYAWHTNFDADSNSETVYDWNILNGTVPGSFSAERIAIDNPITFPAPYSSTTNTFIWPIIQTGPSPTMGMNRVYILGKNNTTHGAATTCENAYIAYADYSTDQLTNNTALTWSYTSVPDLNDWNHDTSASRTPYYGFSVSDDGFICLMGYHVSAIQETNDLDVWLCDNYGAGTWSHYTASSNIPSWNPPTNYGTGPGFYTGVSDQNMMWKPLDSSHINAVLDDSEHLHFFGMWNLYTALSTYVSGLNTIKEVSFNCNLYQFSIKEIYPRAGTSSDTLYWQPWDQDANHVVDVYDSTNGNPVIPKDWNYSYWSTAAGNNALGAQYNNFKMTQAGDDGWMAAVWQNCRRSYAWHVQGNTAYTDYTNAPEIYISISSDFGSNWSDPISINAVEIPEFANNTPMWVYPAAAMTNLGIVNGHPMASLGLMFYNDTSWGSYVVGATGTQTGGMVKFMEIQIDMSTLVPTRITGNVRNSFTQFPIPGATINNGLTTVVTDLNGNYSLPAEPGSYTLTVTADGYQTWTMNDLVVSPNQTTIQDVDLQRIITITGQIYGVNPSVPLNGATATFVGTQTYSANTNSQGTYNIPNVLAHQIYQFTFSKPGFTSFTDNVEILDDDMNMGIFTLQGTPNTDEHEVAYNNAFKGAYPNPFRTATTLEFTLKNAGPVEMDIYNLIGQKVMSLSKPLSPKGLSRMTWDGKDKQGRELASGVYFCRLQAGAFTETRKVMVLR